MSRLHELASEFHEVLEREVKSRQMIIATDKKLRKEWEQALVDISAQARVNVAPGGLEPMFLKGRNRTNFNPRYAYELEQWLDSIGHTDAIYFGQYTIGFMNGLEAAQRLFKEVLAYQLNEEARENQMGGKSKSGLEVLKMHGLLLVDPMDERQKLPTLSVPTKDAEFIVNWIEDTIKHETELFGAVNVVAVRERGNYTDILFGGDMEKSKKLIQLAERELEMARQLSRADEMLHGGPEDRPQRSRAERAPDAHLESEYEDRTYSESDNQPDEAKEWEDYEGPQEYGGDGDE